MNSDLVVLKSLLSLLLLGMFAYGIFGFQAGRVYCKGRWYDRDKSPVGFWFTLAIYLFGPPIILTLVWRAA